MSFGSSFQSSAASSASRLLQQSLLLVGANKNAMTATRQIIMNRAAEPSLPATQPTATTATNNGKYSYRTCPICSQRLLVRINGSFVYKWISTHFSTRHHEWMHVVVNLHES